MNLRSLMTGEEINSKKQAQGGYEMKKKLLSILLGTALMAAALSGCGNKPASDGGKTPAADVGTGKNEENGEPVSTDPADVTGEFTYWTYTDSANNLVKEFNKVYPNVTVDLHVFGGDEYKTKILTALQSGTDVPDAFDLDEGYMYEFLDSDLIADLSYIGIEELTKDFYDFQIAQMKDSKGNYKALMYQSSPVALWYLKDACEEWLGTSDPEEISTMLSDWDTIITKGEEISQKSDGRVKLWPNISEMVKVDAFSFEPLVRDGRLNITDEWTGMIDDMRKMYGSEANAELNSWSSEWAAAWNDGTILFRAMPSWDFFTDWDANKGNVGIAVPYRASYEGGTGACVYNNSENKEVAGEFLKFIAGDEFQKINLENYNQVPASKKVCDELAEGFAAEDYGGQNILATYSEICNNIVGITPDKYTRSTQNKFQEAAANGIKEGKDNGAILEEFKAKLKDQYPEVVMD